MISPPRTKIVFDKILSIFLLLLSSPVWLLVVIASLTESLFSAKNRGPLFYSETRVSMGEQFSLYKFRILRKEAITRIRSGAVPKEVENEPGTLTVTGRFLKKFGLDELAQLVNIVIGDMSIVGPRPKPVAEYSRELELGVTARQLIKAGLTGPVQIMKGTKRTTGEQYQADVDYMNLLRTGTSWEILKYDTRVMLKTAKVMLKGTGE
ncbi:MAG TPA: hypothetical protein ENI11_00540 [Actinobacteria bacterium]|nr:hypothetical protein [Actinomycetota bacterium]